MEWIEQALTFLASTAATGGSRWGRLIQGGGHGHAADQIDVGRQVAADGTACLLTVSEQAEFPGAEPAGDNLNHFQSQLGAGSILLFGRLPGLFTFRFAVPAGSQFRVFPFAVEADEDG